MPSSRRTGTTTAQPLGDLRQVPLRRFAGYGRNCSIGMRHRRQSQVMAGAVESIIEIAKQVFFAELSQHVRTHEGEHGLRVYVREQKERTIILAVARELVQGVKSR